MEGTCTKCEAAATIGPGDLGLCEACRDARYPPIESSRGDQWSPLKVGLLSLFCDFMMIPTILAIVRGVRELRQVARREQAGLYRDEHARVRTGAVWAVVLGAVRPGFLLGSLALGAVAEPATVAVPALGDELDEVLPLLEAEGPGRRELGQRQFLELLEDPGPRDVERAFAVARRHAGDGTETTSRIVETLARTAPLAPADLDGIYPALDAPAREAVLVAILAPGRTADLDAALALVESDPRQERVLARGAIAEVPGGDRLALARLYALPEDHGDRMTASWIARDLCLDGGPGSLSEVGEALVADVSARSAALEGGRGEDVSRRIALTDGLVALGCVRSQAAGQALREALALADPRVAVAAAAGLLTRGDRLPDAAVERLAASVESRVGLHQALARVGRVARMPASTRSAEALALAAASSLCK